MIADNIAKKSNHFFRSKGKTLLFISILFIVSRLLILFLNFEPLIMEEERYNGTIALEVLNGLKMPLFYYQHQPYAPGAMVVGLLSTPFFLIFGSSYISLKITALILSFGGFILWYIFLDKFFNQRVALIASFLLILSPPNNIRYSLLSLGNHYEINLFTILAFLIFYNIFFSESSRGKKHIGNFFLLGLISGFACYFALTFFAAFLTILIFWFVFDKGLFRKGSFLYFVTGFIIGFSTWIYNAVFFNLKGFDFHGKSIYLFEGSEAYLTKFVRMVVTGVPLSFAFEGIKGKTFDAYFYYLVIVLSFAFLIKLNFSHLKKAIFGIVPVKRFRTSPVEISKETALLVFPVLYCLIFTALNFSVPKKVFSEMFILAPYDNIAYLAYRYFTPLFPFFFSITAIALDKLWDSGNFNKIKRYFCLFILITVFFVCGLSFLKMLKPVDIGKGLLYSGSDYFIMGEKFAERYRDIPLEKSLQLIKKIDNQYRIVALRGFGRYFGVNKDLLPDFLRKIKNMDDGFKLPLYQGSANGLFDSLMIDSVRLTFVQRESNEQVAVKDLIEEVDERYRVLFYREMGHILRRNVNVYTNKGMEATLRLINYFDRDFKPEFCDLEIECSGKDINSLVERIDKLPENYRGDFYKALGKGMSWLLWESAGSFEAIVKIIPEKYRSYLYEGAGTFAGSLFINDIDKAIKIIQSLDINYRFYLYHALGEALFWKYGSNFKKAVGCIESIDKEGRRYCYEGLGSGIGYMLWWNPERIDELLNKVEKTYKAFCEEGIRKRIEEDFLLSKQNYYYYFHLKIKY